MRRISKKERESGRAKFNLDGAAERFDLRARGRLLGTDLPVAGGVETPSQRHPIAERRANRGATASLRRFSERRRSESYPPNRRPPRSNHPRRLASLA